MEFLHTGGVKDFVDFLSKGEPISDIWRIQGEGTYKEETQAVGEGGELHAQEIERTCGVDIALRWVNGYDTTIMSFVNIVETPGGGTHVDGFMNAITKQIRKAVEDNARKLKVNMKDSAMKVERDDIQAGLVAVVTARVAEPQFQGQTKDVLGTAAGQADRHPAHRQAIRRDDHRLQARVQGTIRPRAGEDRRRNARTHPVAQGQGGHAPQERARIRLDAGQTLRLPAGQ